MIQIMKVETIEQEITKQDVINYWGKIVDESTLSVDVSEMATHCWRCGCKRKLSICEIVPVSLGGKKEPHNQVLLCSKCKAESPKVSDPEIMWDWLHAYKSAFYDTFWRNLGIIEYKNIYGVDFFDELKARNISDSSIIFDGLFAKGAGIISSSKNPASVAGLLRVLLKRYDLNHNLTTPKDIKSIFFRNKIPRTI